MLLLLALSFSPASFAASKASCSALLSKDAIDLAISTPDLRQQMLARKQYPGDIYFAVPEFKPLLTEMLDQLDRFEQRAQAVKSKNPLSLISRPLLRRRLSNLRKHIHKMLNEEILYWDVIETAASFARAADILLNLDGTRDAYERFLPVSFFNLGAIRATAEKFPVIFVPTLRTLSQGEINRIWGKGILPLGLVVKTTRADNFNYGARRHFYHDYKHAVIFTSALEHTLSNHASDDWERMSEILSKSAAVTTRFFSEVDKLEDAQFRSAVELSYFISDHDYAPIFQFLQPGQEALLRPYIERRLNEFFVLEGAEAPQNLPVFQKIGFWMNVGDWIGNIGLACLAAGRTKTGRRIGLEATTFTTH